MRFFVTLVGGLVGVLPGLLLIAFALESGVPNASEKDS